MPGLARAKSRQDGSWQKINFPSPGRLEIKVGAMRLVNVRSQCVDPLLTAHVALYEIPYEYLRAAPPSAHIRWYCRSCEHSVACHTPDLCGCQSKASAPPSPTSPKPQAVDKAISNNSAAGTATSLISGSGCYQGFSQTSYHLLC